MTNNQLTFVFQISLPNWLEKRHFTLLYLRDFSLLPHVLRQRRRTFRQNRQKRNEIPFSQSKIYVFSVRVKRSVFSHFSSASKHYLNLYDYKLAFFVSISTSFIFSLGRNRTLRTRKSDWTELDVGNGGEWPTRLVLQTLARGAEPGRICVTASSESKFIR